MTVSLLSALFRLYYRKYDIAIEFSFHIFSLVWFFLWRSEGEGECGEVRPGVANRNSPLLIVPQAVSVECNSLSARPGGFTYDGVVPLDPHLAFHFSHPRPDLLLAVSDKQSALIIDFSSHSVHAGGEEVNSLSNL